MVRRRVSAVSGRCFASPGEPRGPVCEFGPRPSRRLLAQAPQDEEPESRYDAVRSSRERRLSEFNCQTAMSGHETSFSRRRSRPRPVSVMSLGRRGRRECRVQAAPMVRVQQKSTRQNHRFSRSSRHSLRGGFNGVLRALPGDQTLLSPSVVGLIEPGDLSTSLGAPGPHDFSVRHFASRLAQKRLTRQRPPHPRLACRDDRAYAPLA
jgi:hypothetical protein